MMFKLLGLTLCLVLACTSFTSAQNAAGNAVDIMTADGLHIEFPYYLNVTTLDPAFRDATVFHMAKIIKYIREVAGKSLMSERVNRFGWAGVTTNLAKMGYESKNARKNLKRTVGTGGTFNSKMNEMFNNMMAESKPIEKTVEPEDPLELKEEIDSVLSGLVEAIEGSPVAGYFNWPEGKINGESFVSLSARYMARLSKQGYRTFLGCIGALLALIVKLGSLG